MSVTFSAAESLIREQIHQDLITAIQPTKIYDNPAFEASDGEDLPMVFVELKQVEPKYGESTAGVGQLCLLFDYEITAIFSWPSCGTIEQDKITNSALIVTALTNQPSLRYTANNYPRMVKEINFDYSPQETVDHFYTATIKFVVEVVSTP